MSYRIEWRQEWGSHSAQPIVVEGPGDGIVGVVLWENIIVASITQSNTGRWRLRLRKFREGFGVRVEEIHDMDDPGVNVSAAVRAGNGPLIAKVSQYLPDVPSEAILSEEDRKDFVLMLQRSRDPKWNSLTNEERARIIREERKRGTS